MTQPRGTEKAGRAHGARGFSAEPTLPAWKAFVVQFTRETGPEAGTFCGRAEHLSTGQRARFESVQELVEFVHAVLRETHSKEGKVQKK